MVAVKREYKAKIRYREIMVIKTPTIKIKGQRIGIINNRENKYAIMSAH